MVLAAISFAAPAMLAGMGLVALPITAHLLTRRTRRRIVFPTVRLLTESSQSTSWLYRMRRLLFLLLRCLAVCLVALAFARPQWSEQETPTAAGDEGAAVVLVLDASASITQRRDGVSGTNSIRALAERTLSALDAGVDRVGVVYASARPRAALPELSDNLEAIREELGRYEPTQERANFPEAIALAAELLRAHTGQRRLVILSDMQRSNWGGVTLGDRAGEALPEGTVLTIVPVGAAGGENVSLSNARTLPVQPMVDDEVKLVVRVANYTADARTVRVKASADGRALATVPVALKAWAGADAEVVTRFTSPGEHRVVFSIGTDSLAVDNAAYVTVRAVRRVPVVVVSDDNPNQPGTGSYFITRALAPRGTMADDLEVQHLTSAGLSYGRIADAEVVFVGYVDKLGASASRALYMYANQGGGVAVFCGQGPVGDNLLALRDAAEGADILPWTATTLRDLAADGGFLQIGEGAWQRRPLAEFDEPSRHALQQVRFGRVWLTGRLAGEATGLLWYTDKTPAMSARRVGAGKLLVCNFSPALRCSDLGKYGGFVALMRSMFSYLRPEQTQHGRAIVGEPFYYPVTVATEAEAGRIAALGPDEKPSQIDTASEAGSRRTLVHFRRTRLPGFHEVLIDERVIASAAVNVDGREGDLRRMSREAIVERLRTGQSDPVIHDVQQTGPILRLRGYPMWPWSVLAAMVAVGLELILLGIWKR